MKKLVLIVVLLLTSTLVLAQEGNPDLAYSWLLDQPNQNVFSAALTSLALSKADTSRAQPYLDYIISNKDPTQPCWPAQSCNIKDTSLALIVESKMGFNSDFTAIEIADWLASKQRAASLPGKWVLQIITKESGTCSLSYQRVGEQESNPFQLIVDQGRISHGACSDQTFFDLGTCLNSNPLSKPSTKVIVSCSSLADSQISLTYVETNTYYLITSPQQTRASFTINNGYFGNLQDTIYANWALSQISENEVNSLLWLRKNTFNKIQGESILYLLTNDQAYLNSLINLQSNFGAFGDQGSSPTEFLTGFASLILQESGQFPGELQRARAWLGSKQKDDGSWSSQVDTTAMILYGAYSGGSLPVIPPIPPEPEPEPTCIPNWECGEWSFCTDGKQTRECQEVNECNIECQGELSCITQRECEECTPEWQCTEWSECTSSADLQTRSCRVTNDCEVPCLDNPECVEEQQCEECVPDWECTPWSICSEFDTQTRECGDASNCGVDCPLEDLNCLDVRDCTEEEEEEPIEEFEPPTTGEETTKEEEVEAQICVVNGECEPDFGENEDNCPDDCLTTLPPTDLPPPDFGDFPDDEFEGEEEPESGSGFFIYLIIILLLIILVATYFLVFRKKKSSKGRPVIKLPTGPIRPPLFGSETQKQIPARPQQRLPIRRVKREETEIE